MYNVAIVFKLHQFQIINQYSNNPEQALFNGIVFTVSLNSIRIYEFFRFLLPYSSLNFLFRMSKKLKLLNGSSFVYFILRIQARRYMI